MNDKTTARVVASLQSAQEALQANANTLAHIADALMGIAKGLQMIEDALTHKKGGGNGQDKSTG